MNSNISVLMSVYKNDNAFFLKQAIDSVLNQTLLPAEIVIIKDGVLTIDLYDVLNIYKDNKIIKVYGYEENKGLGYALAFGILKCKYDIVARMDADDIARNDRFEKQYDTLIEKKVDLVGSNTIEFIDDITNVISVRVMPETHLEIYKYSKSRNPIIHPSVMVCKNGIIESGNFRQFFLCEDYDMWTRMLMLGFKMYNIQENLVYMRISKDFYKRRGGLKYCKSILKLKKLLYKNKYYNLFQYFKTSLATIVTTLSPSWLRGFIYKKILRG